jgi:hypothetical protein
VRWRMAKSTRRSHGFKRRPGDDSKAAVEEKLGGGDARAQKGEEESGDRCREDRARSPAFYRGRREAETSVTQSEEGGRDSRLS